MESMANVAHFFRQNGPASPPAGHKPNALCPRLPLRPLPSARLARPSLLPFIPPLPAPGRPAESLAWRCVAGALLGFGNKCSILFLAVRRSEHGDHLGDIAMAVSNLPDFVDENSHRPSSGYYSPT